MAKEKKEKFYVKSIMYISQSRSREVDGPCKPTIAEAITAFHGMLVSKGWDDLLVFRAFIAKRCEDAVAHACDNRGSYQQPKVNGEEFKQMLTSAGVKISSIEPAFCTLPMRQRQGEFDSRSATKIVEIISENSANP